MANFTILEPMSAGDVIDRSVRLYRRNFAPLLSIVAIPSLVGYLASTMIWFGYSQLVLGSVENGGEVAPTAGSIVMLIAGIILYPIWIFVLFFTISGLVRVVGDHLMLGESITFRKCFAAARSRLGDIFLMCLLSLAILAGLYTIFSFIFFFVAIVVAFLLGATVSSGLPPWFVGIVTAVLAMAVIAIGIAIALMILSRVIFIPQIVMIEGQSAGSAFSRAMQLGKGNWYKLGAIVLFTYFVSLSLLTALLLPLLGVLYFLDILSVEIFFGSGWNIVYTSFSQLSSLLCLPIWFICFTLLYFDSRVRKEAYDLELLAREVNPGFYWQPQPAVMGYPPSGAMNWGRTYVQTSPLGLAGWRPNPPPAPPPEPPTMRPPSAPNWSPPPDWTRQRPQPPFSPPVNGGNAVTQPTGESDTLPLSPTSPVAQFTAPPASNRQPEVASVQRNNNAAACTVCGAMLEPEARFCMRCGTAV